MALPTGECAPASRWIGASRLHTLIPGDGSVVEALTAPWEFGRLKNDWALLPPRVRRIERVRLHADLTDAGPAGDGAG